MNIEVKTWLYDILKAIKEIEEHLPLLKSEIERLLNQD
ncbi:hypothetical protein EDB95_0754 [Dinghuibacter silviterrae]|uniref:Uncharacterized protein n=1 Tax=Dinghuibacter silviterrae TaxID=1539049 RepID=A0A4R8DNX1_9BACT|nr:hypothetical protein EDB95_0754 [Dinghuibacter silviterrae]